MLSPRVSTSNLSVLVPSCLQYVPFQTPTLGLCVQRYVDIETFKPEPDWVLGLTIFKRGRICKAAWESGRSFNRQKVERLLAQCFSEDGPPAPARSANVTTKSKHQGRPTPVNTVALLKGCSKALGTEPHAALQTAERLYLSVYLPYPHTESTACPASFDIQESLQAQSNDIRWGSYSLLQKGVTKAKGGFDMGDHPPITPCRSAVPHELSGDVGRVYDFVVRHFIASVSPDAIWISTKVDLEVDVLNEKGKFAIRGKQLAEDGFLAVLLHKKYGEEPEETNERVEEVEKDEELPDFAKGEVMALYRQHLAEDNSGWRWPCNCCDQRKYGETTVPVD
jgi:DNA topoisomerase-3